MNSPNDLALDARGGIWFTDLAANDQLAIGALHAAWRRRLRVPADLSIVGFDDLPVTRYLAPPLTTVRHPIAELGQQAAEVLIATLEGNRDATLPEDLVVQPELVVRESSAAPPAR